MAGPGGARKRGRPVGVVPAWALLLSVFVSCLDSGVRRKKRSHLAGGRPRTATTKWYDFRLPLPPPPPPPQPKCTDCGTTTTAQWRTGPMGPRTLCNNCGGRRRLAGEQWGTPRTRRTQRAAPRARDVHDQPPAQQVTSSPPATEFTPAPAPATAVCDHPPPQQILPVPASPPSSQICEQGLVPAPNVLLEIASSPNRVTAPPPESVPAPATSPATVVSDHPPPQEILSVPESPPSNPICEQAGLVPAPSVLLERTTSPDRVTPSSPATEPLPAPAPTPATAVSDHPPPPPLEIPRVLFLASPPSSLICKQGLAPVPDVLPTSPPPPISAPESSASGTRRRRRAKRRSRDDAACKHCESTTSPQWRGGPEGCRTLCNACGMRYRQGRLLPEYRPKASPNFDENVHTSSHSEVIRRRWRNNVPVPMRTTLTLLPPPLPVVNLVNDLRAAANKDSSANNNPMEERSSLGPFQLLHGLATPMPPPPPLPVVNLVSEPRAAANEDSSANNAAAAGASDINDPVEERSSPGPFLFHGLPMPLPLFPMVNLAKEDDAANYATMDDLGSLDPFLLDGPAAPMLVDEREEAPTLINFF